MQRPIGFLSGNQKFYLLDLRNYWILLSFTMYISNRFDQGEIIGREPLFSLDYSFSVGRVIQGISISDQVFIFKLWPPSSKIGYQYWCHSYWNIRSRFKI